ncbi:NTP transferase domain-containing protein [Sphingomonas sp.]|uniref:NTP transferase domain-containing protein n=1 Tax=Sphingomonas sp. TaxID=28214 RepID=UPI003B3AC0B6
MGAGREVSARWTAILLAGQRPGVDPLAAAFGQEWKALVPIAGEAMLSRVARTLLACPSIGRVLILAQTPDALLTGDCAWLADEPRVGLASSGGGIATSIAVVAGGPAAPWPVLATTADHPLLTVEMVEAMIAGSAGADVAVGVVGRRVLLGRYPDNRRTWLRFADDGWTGANLFALRTPDAIRALDAWSTVEQDRKKAIKLVWHFGAWLAIRAVTRTITLAGAMRRAGRRLGFDARPVALPFAEAGIDVDKPADHALAESILDAREAG